MHLNSLSRITDTHMLKLAMTLKLPHFVIFDDTQYNTSLDLDRIKTCTLVPLLFRASNFEIFRIDSLHRLSYCCVAEAAFSPERKALLICLFLNAPIFCLI